MARPRDYPDPRRGFQDVRTMARRHTRSGGARAAQARPQDRDGGGLAALRRNGTADAQSEAARRAARVAQEAKGATRATQGPVRLEAAQADLSGRLVAVAHGISKSYGGRLVVRDFSTRIMRGDPVGIVGSNSVGKTTLLHRRTDARYR